MARRNVELILKARDESRGIITRAEKNVETFRNSLNSVKGSANSVDGELRRLGTAFNTLKDRIAKAGGLNVVEKSFKELEAASQSLQQEIAQNTAEVSRNQKAMFEAAASVEKLEREERKLSSQLSRTNDKYSQASQRLKQLRASQGEAERSYRKFNRQFETGINRTAKAIERYERINGELEDLRQKQTETGDSSRQLSYQIEQKERSLRSAELAVDKLAERQKELTPELNKAREGVKQYSAEVVRQERVVARLEARLNTVSQEHKESSASLSVASTAYNKFSSALTRANASLRQSKAAFETSEEASLDALGGITRMERAFNRADQTIRSKFLPAFREQAARVSEIRQRFTETSAAAAKLGQELARTAVPSKDLLSAFDRMRAAAAQARQEFRRQGTALSVMRQQLISSAKTTEEAENRIQVLRSTLQTARTGADALSTSIGRATQAIRSYNDPTRRAADNTRRLNQSLRSTRASATQAATGVNKLSLAFRRFYGDSRRALSILQRVRGEALSLAAAYGGLFAAIQGIGNIVEVANTVHAATNRLAVVFDGNQTDIATELDFIRRNAARLGVEFGVLAQEFTKFSIATKGTNLEGQKTRDIFQSVAEAARVNGASVQQLRGTFVALTQIVSKGAFSMEEVRQQLGDRLPGAVRILADAIGVGTEELYKLIEQGQLSSDYLVEFAQELDRRFGKQLPSALQLLATSIGRLENAAFHALNRVGQAGAVAGFQHFLDTLTGVLESPQFADFLERIGTALEALSGIAARLVQHWDLLIIGIGTFIGSRLGVFIGVLVNRVANMTLSVLALGTAFTKLRGIIVFLTTTMQIFFHSATTAANRLTILAGAIRAISSPAAIGVGFTALVGLFLLMSTRAQDATERLHEHQEIIDRVRNSYDNLGRSVEAVKDALEGLTVLEATQRLTDLSSDLAKVREQFNRILGSVADPSGHLPRSPEEVSFSQGLASLLARYDNGTIHIEEFNKQVSDLTVALIEADPQYRSLGRRVVRVSNDFVKFARASREAELVLTVLTGTAEEAEAAVRELTGRTEELEELKETVAEALDPKVLEDFTAALRKLFKEAGRGDAFWEQQEAV